jgi:Transposase domain (DUF772)
VERVISVGGASLPQGWKRSPACWVVDHATDLFLQRWFNLSDPGMEEAFYESPVLRRFAGVDLGRAAAPDEATILRFRHLLEEHALGAA